MSTQQSANPHLVVGVDVGGTFTDLFVLDERDGSARIVKVPSTRGEEARGFMHGVTRVTDTASALATIVHGTTVGTNALLERKVARTGIITTRGFRDVLEMRRRDRPQTWGLRGYLHFLFACLCQSSQRASGCRGCARHVAQPLCDRGLRSAARNPRV